MTDLVRPPDGEPERSLVAPVGHDTRESSDDFSDSIKKLLAGLEPKIASEALARAETLGKLPPAQQTLLRCAMAAASETFKKAEILQDELARVRERQRHADTEQVAESLVLSRRSALAEAQVAELREDLIASVAANQIRETRARKHSGYLWLALLTAVSAGVMYVCLFSGAPLSAVATDPETDQSAAAGSAVRLHRAPDQNEWQPVYEPQAVALRTAAQPPDPVVEQALGRLDGALARVPLPEVDGVLREANRLLLASRIPPCFVHLGEGEVSILVRAGGNDAAPLRKALVRCAEAVEHVTE